MLTGTQVGVATRPVRGDAAEIAIGRLRFSPNALVRFALVATAITYIQTIAYAFVFDDLLQIEMNPWIQSWRFWRSFFTGDVWSFGRPRVLGNYYRPMFLLWLTGNYSLFKLTPGWWHLSAVALHIGATFLVYKFATRILEDHWKGATAALLFGVYPLHIETVAWVSGGPEALLTIFFLASLLAFQNWIERKGTRWLLVSLLFFVLALLSKETALAFVPVVATYAWWSRGPEPRSWREIVLRVSPYLLVSAVYMAVRRLVLSGLSVSNYPRPTSWVLWSVPQALWFYLRQLLWPFRLSIFYDFDLTKSFSLAAMAATVAVGVVIAALVIAAGRRTAVLATVWILASLAPALAGMKVFQWHDYVHDRYLYLPSVIMVIVFTIAVARLSQWIGRTEVWTSKLTVALPLVVAVVFVASTIVQSRQWESDLALFSHAHQAAPRNPVPADYLARTLFGLERKDEAMAIYRELLQKDPDYWQANYVLGLAYYQMGRYAEAESYLKKATRVWSRDFVRPEPAQFYYLGITQQRNREYQDAEASLRKAVDLRPDAVGYRDALGNVLRQLGRNAEAEEQFRLEAANRKTALERAKEFGQ